MMRITKLRTWLVEGIKYNWTLVKFETEDGFRGIGEATNWPSSTMVEAACEAVGSYILGEDSRRIDFFCSKCYRDMNWLGLDGPLLSAISGVDIALWDIAGKRADLNDNLSSLNEDQKDLALDRVKEVGEALGPRFPIAVETHAMLNEPTGRRDGASHREAAHSAGVV